MKRLLRGVQLLQAPGSALQRTDVLFDGGTLVAMGADAGAAAGAGTEEQQAPPQWLLAPMLVDAHSHLEDPQQGSEDILASLSADALAAGYGTVALLPRALSWRDRPERLTLQAPAGLKLLLWGALTTASAGEQLAPLGDLLSAGAIGLSDGEALPPLPLLERVLQLGEADGAPLLVAPRDLALTQGGFVREGVDTLRLGWPADPYSSEVMPLHSLLALAQRAANLRLMNLSTAAAVELLQAAAVKPAASVCWWHLLADHSGLDPLAEGWRLVPSLGGRHDRAALREALRSGLLQAVAVHHSPIDHEDHLLPLDQRRPGVAGYQAVLPALFQSLVKGDGWQLEELWQVLCWGPAAFLGLQPEVVEPGGCRWLLFDPDAPHQPQRGSLAANQPLAMAQLQGQVLATGLGGWITER